MKGAVWGRTGRVSTWTSRRPFTGSVWKRFVRSTATCSTFISGLRARHAYTVPMRNLSRPHYTMGGLWVDYHLMSTFRTVRGW